MHAQVSRVRTVSGHLWVYDGKRGKVWYAKVRLPGGRRENRKLGAHWSGRGRPPEGYLTKRTAEQALDALLTDARRGHWPGRVTGGEKFGAAAEAWFAWGEAERDWKPSTRRDYASLLKVHLLPGLGDLPLGDITTPMLERWRAGELAAGRMTKRTAGKAMVIVGAIFERARRHHAVASNPVADVEKLRVRFDASDYDFYSPEEVWALVRQAETEPPEDEGRPELRADAQQDATLFLTAAFTGLRMGELLALRIRDVDFEAEAIRVMGSVDKIAGVGTTKGGRGRSTPMVPDVATALAKLLQRDRFTGTDDFVFVNEVGRWLDGSALRRRFIKARDAAALRPLRFHDLRHTFASLAITQASVVDLQAWMGHANTATTMRYLHHKSRSGEAKLLAGAFAVESAESGRANRVDREGSSVIATTRSTMV